MNNTPLNLIAAIVLSIGIIFGWQYFYERPKLEKQVSEHKIYTTQIAEVKQQNVPATIASREDVLIKDSRIKVITDVLSGSIALKGLRFDDLILLKYKKDVSPDSDHVVLFSPSSTKEAYFAEFGWTSGTKDALFPNQETTWSADSLELTKEKPVNLTWTNANNITFKVNIAVDDDYLFKITQTIINGSGKPIDIQYYGLINRNYSDNEKALNILHQGLIGVINDKLEEYTYDKIKDKKLEKFNQTIIEWLGITDKYWLAAFVPDKNFKYSSNINFAIKNSFDKYQIDFISNNQIVEPGEKSEILHRLFAGAKKVDLLDKYEKAYNIKLFDRAIDFGWFYILTKPVFNALNFFYKYVGNFGISILIVTVIIKLAMFTLASRSYRSMKKIKQLQPEIDRIKELYGEDKTRMNQEVMQLYKKHKANPISGCLPIIVQIPVFFSIYKVLYVTIEMRHAPFYGWIRDLSAPDPTTIFNLFGLLQFTPPSFLMIGVWPIIMALTMFLQQRMSPEPADPVQAQVMKLMPLMFLFMFSNFPAGLLIYWSWNNILSIIQQYYINKLDKNVT